MPELWHFGDSRNVTTTPSPHQKKQQPNIQKHRALTGKNEKGLFLNSLSLHYLFKPTEAKPDVPILRLPAEPDLLPLSKKTHSAFDKAATSSSHPY